MNHAIISVGSNINPNQNIKQAIDYVKREQSLLNKSTFVRTQPIGDTNQPDFINGALLVATDMELTELNTWLKTLERKLGRVKTADKFGPRIIDLDIVIWNGKVVDNDFYERKFVRDAVLELLPDVK